MSENPEKNLDALLSNGGIASLLQNPEIAAKLPRIMEALAPVMAEMKAEKAGEGAPAQATGTDGASGAADASPVSAADAADALQKALPAMGKAHPSASRRMALLRALAPYLSADRQSALDTVIKVSTLIDLLSEVM